MIQLTAVLYRKPELTHEEFVDHWTTRHGPLMIETAGVAQYLRGYVQHVRTDDSVWSGPAGCDGVAQQWFDDLDAFQAMLADPDYAQVIAPDEERFFGPITTPLRDYEPYQRLDSAPSTGDPMSSEMSSAVVIGGGSGIGAATVGALVEAGYAVAVADRDVDAARSVAESTGASAAFATDVADETSVSALAASMQNQFGGVHTVIHAAGISGRFCPLTSLSSEEWNQTLAINLSGPFLTLKYFLPLLEQSAGSATFVSSGAARRGVAHLGDYSASKHGLLGLVRSAALEYGRSGVRINAVCPGTIDTPMLERSVGDRTTMEKLGRMAPVGRLGTASEVANLLVWLSSDEASFMTGAVVDVDGGVSAA